VIQILKNALNALQNKQQMEIYAFIV